MASAGAGRSGRVSRAAGLDFDGVIRDGTVPVPGAAAAIAALMAVRPVYVCTTVRPAEAAAFLSALGFETETDESCPLCPGEPGCPCCGGSGEVIWWTDRSRLLVTSRKLPGVLVDDRAVTFRSWPQALAELEGEPGMSEVPPAAVRAEAVEALALFLHDEDDNGCYDGPAAVCGRWNSPPTPGMYQAEKHRGYYRDRARAALEAAAPHLTAAGDAAWRASYERIAGLHLEAEADVKRAAERLAELEAIAADLAAVLEGYGCPSPGHDWDDRCPRCQVFARWRTVKEAGS